MSIRVTQLAYNSGVLSGLMAGRADDTKYGSGVQVCRNVRCTPQGPLENRPGFLYVAETKHSDKACRLIPFTYSANQTMVIELGDKYARFHTQGKTLMDEAGAAPYEIETPWSADDLFELHYTQNADVMTVVHPSYAPQEIRRYSLTDWRIQEVNLVTTLGAPQNVGATRLTEAANDSNKDKYTQSYVVTALNEDRTEESDKSKAATCVANLFATGTTVKVSWDAVDGASFYRVYKLQGGIYGYIGQTQELSIIDDNIAPETGETPPYLDDVFKVAKGIESVTVVNGGSGYVNRGIKSVTVSQSYTGYPFTAGLEESYAAQKLASATWRNYYGKVTSQTITGAPTVTITSASGSGAVLRASVELHVANPSSYDSDNGYTYSFSAFVVITGVTVVSPGSGYSSDAKLNVDWSTCSATITYYGQHDLYESWQTESRTVSKTFSKKYSGVGEVAVQPAATISVSDATGRGAELVPVIEDGRIVSVTIRSGGAGYTAPTLKVVAQQGSGANLTADVADTGDYPAAVGYFEQRRIFAGSPLKPQQIWMTATGTESNMTYHLPLQDDDRISFAVASRDLNQIQHVVALQQLIMLTSAAEWRVSPLNSDAITPTSISVRPQSYVGASTVQPVMANNTAIYAASRGGHVREIAYNYNAGGYVTGDLSLRATALFDGYEVVDLAFSKEPFNTVWAVSSSGALLGLTYVPEQSVGAWFEYKTEGSFESTAVVQEGADDVVYVVTNRDINGAQKRVIECSTNRNAGVFLDCAGLYDGEATSTVTGVTWLAGTTVSVNADGFVFDGIPVGEDGTVALPLSAKRVVVGLPYSVEVQTMPIVAQVSDGSLAKGHTKNIKRVWLRLSGSAAPEVGPDFENMAQVKTRSREPLGTPPEAITGVVEVIPPGEWKEDTGVCIRMSKPLPFTLISHTAEIELGG